LQRSERLNLARECRLHRASLERALPAVVRRSFVEAGNEDKLADRRPELQREMQDRFEKVYVRKPKASRDRSREVYLVAKRLRSNAQQATKT